MAKTPQAAQEATAWCRYRIYNMTSLTEHHAKGLDNLHRTVSWCSLPSFSVCWFVFPLPLWGRPMGQRGSLLTGLVAKDKKKKNNNIKQTKKRFILKKKSLLCSVLKCADGNIALLLGRVVLWHCLSGCSRTLQAGKMWGLQTGVVWFLPTPVSFCSPSDHTSPLSAATEALSHSNATNTEAVCRPLCSPHTRRNSRWSTRSTMTRFYGQPLHP